MAEKEATVYIVDLGRSMGAKKGGRDRSDLDWAMDYVWDRITTTVGHTVDVEQRMAYLAAGRNRTKDCSAWGSGPPD